MTFTLFDFHVNHKDEVFWISLVYLEFHCPRMYDGALFHLERVGDTWQVDFLFWNLLKGLFHDRKS